MLTDILKYFLVPEDKFIFGFADLNGLTSRPYSAYNYGIFQLIGMSFLMLRNVESNAGFSAKPVLILISEYVAFVLLYVPWANLIKI